MQEILNTKIKVLLTILAVLLVSLAAWFVFAGADEPPEGMVAVDVYRLNANSGALVPRRHFVAAGEHADMARDVFNIFTSPSSDTANLRSAFPYGLAMPALFAAPYAANGGGLTVNFSREYLELTPADELYLRAALVWTMTGLEFVGDVRILVEGEEILRSDNVPLGALNRVNTAASPAISPVRVDFERVTIYFIDRDELVLVAEERLVRVNPERPIENYYIEALIEGPRNLALSAAVPAETRLWGDVQTNDGTAYVNLSGDFVARSAGSPEILRLSIMSVVNSLTGLPDIYRVQFLIESEKVDSLRGIWELHAPIYRDETFISATQPDL
ncbi:MAG: GerMN domain-containing protein [Defluviitaleaceae bacterium]|nr:GerMN domain-containing protein [Defluviitaleaceae bacterium]